MDYYKTIMSHIESAVTEILNFDRIPTKYRDAMHEACLHLAEEIERESECTIHQ